MKEARANYKFCVKLLANGTYGWEIRTDTKEELEEVVKYMEQQYGTGTKLTTEAEKEEWLETKDDK